MTWVTSDGKDVKRWGGGEAGRRTSKLQACDESNSGGGNVKVTTSTHDLMGADHPGKRVAGPGRWFVIHKWARSAKDRQTRRRTGNISPQRTSGPSFSPPPKGLPGCAVAPIRPLPFHCPALKGDLAVSNTAAPPPPPDCPTDKNGGLLGPPVYSPQFQSFRRSLASRMLKSSGWRIPLEVHL